MCRFQDLQEVREYMTNINYKITVVMYTVWRKHQRFPTDVWIGTDQVSEQHAVKLASS